MESDKHRSCHPPIRQMTHSESLKIITNISPKSLSSQTALKLAIFDLDDTLITRKSLSSFCTDSDDWVFKYPTVPLILKTLEANNFIILIVTNQLGISKGYFGFSEFQKLIEKFLEKCEISAYVFAATEDDEFRKPAIGCFDYFFDFTDRAKNRIDSSSLLEKRGQSRQPFAVLNYTKTSINSKNNFKKPLEKSKNVPEFTVTDFYLKANKNIQFGLGYDLSTESFYCGDAAGRSTEEKDDFSNSDILFALNINVNFILPEQLFMNHHIAPLLEIPFSDLKEHICLDEVEFRSSNGLDEISKKGKANLLVMLVGPPGCGKTHFAQKYFSKFAIVSYVI